MTTIHAPQDTSPAAAEAQIRALRQLGPCGRLAAGLRFSGSMIARSRAMLRARHPEVGEDDLLVMWIAQTYGAPLAQAVAARLGDSACRRATTSS